MNLVKRKSIRLNGYDYNTPGAYFITICTHNRNMIFSNIVGAIHESPENIYTEYGYIVKDIIENLSWRYNIIVDKYVIMPNHIHLLLIIDDERAIRESPLQYHRSIISKAIGYLKMNVSKQMHLLHYEDKIWQRSYHDHIIRGEKDYKKYGNILIQMYINGRWIVFITAKRNSEKLFRFALKLIIYFADMVLFRP